MKRYCIFGDSWSYGSKIKLPEFKEAPGSRTFQTMFAEAGQFALNKSVEASSNAETLHLINKVDLTDFDVAIVFQTDPLRNILDRKKYNINPAYYGHSSLTDVAEIILLDFYQQLNKINKPILLVGGLSCIAHHLVPDNIHTVSKSWTELVDPGFKDCYFEWTDYTAVVRDIIQCTDDLIEINKQIQSKNYVWQNSDAFGWCHPSDTGYDIMFDVLQQKLNHIDQITS